MISLLEAVGNRAIQIHSSKRKDREQLIKIWTRQHGIQVPLFEAIMRSNGAEGCLMSHGAVAHTLQAPYLVLEDDALPTLAMYDSQHVFHVVQAIQSQQFDIVYLGGLPSLTRIQSTSFPGVYEGRCLATYAMIVSSRAAQKLQTIAYNNVPVDVQLSQDATLRTAIVHPPLFVMAETASDIGASNFTKSLTFSKILRRATDMWRFLVMWQREVLFVFFCVCMGILLRKQTK